MTVQLAPATSSPRGRPRRVSRILAPIVLAIAAAAVIAVVITTPDQSSHRSGGARTSHATVRTPPPYWIVRPGDTLMQIAAKTGVSVAQLQAFNPDVNPLALVPGQRLKAMAASAQANPHARAARTAVLDRPPRPVVRLDRRAHRHQPAHARTAKPSAEAHHALAGRPATAPSPATGLKLPSTPAGQLAAGHARLVGAATRCCDTVRRANDALL